MTVLSDWLVAKLARSRSALRVPLEAIRAQRPVWNLGKLTLVTGAPEILEVFERGSDFLAGCIHRPKLLLGASVLGMEPGGAHTGERADLRDMLAAHLDTFAQILADETEVVAAEWRDSIKHSGCGDLVSGYSERIILRSASRFYGFPFHEARSAYLRSAPGEDTMRLWMRKLGSLVLGPYPAPFGAQSLAHTLRGEAVAYLECALRSISAELEARPAAPDGDGARGLAQLASMRRARAGGLEPSAVENDMLGDIGGVFSAGGVFARAFVHVVDEILRRPQVRDEVVSAVVHDDQAKLQSFALEALRFRPVFPLVARYCPRPTRLESGTVTQIPADSTVLLAPLAGLLDPRIVERPETFLPERFASDGPARDAIGDLLFGRGVHSCIGRAQSMLSFRIMLAGLFRIDALTAASPGKLRYDGTQVGAYELGFLAGAAGSAR